MRVLMAGLGVTGEAVVEALRADGDDVVAFDDRDDAAEIAGRLDAQLVGAGDEAVRDALGAVDLVVVTPGLRPDHRVAALARAAGVPVIGDIELAAQRTQTPLVAVTGTNGKSTITRLTALMLDASGVKAVEAGNIGRAFIEAITEPADVYVVEVSSQQLFSTDRFQPRVAVWSNLSPDHLDWHPDLDHYVAAKARIWANQTGDDLAVVNAEDPVVMAAAAGAPGRVVTFGLDVGDAHVVGGRLVGAAGEDLGATAAHGASVPARDRELARCRVGRAGDGRDTRGCARDVGVVSRPPPPDRAGRPHWRGGVLRRLQGDHARVGDDCAQRLSVSGAHRRRKEQGARSVCARNRRRPRACRRGHRRCGGRSRGRLRGCAPRRAGRLDGCGSRCCGVARGGRRRDPAVTRLHLVGRVSELRRTRRRLRTSSARKGLDVSAPVRSSTRGVRRTRAQDRSVPQSRPATALLVVIGALCTIGLAMVMSASSVNALHTFGSSWHFTLRQTGAVAIGAVALLVCSRVDYHRWRNWALPALGVVGLLLVLVLMPGIGQVAYGARRWLGAGPVQFQPSELAKVALILFGADVLSRHPPPRDGSGPVKVVLGALALLSLLVMLQPDMGTTMVMVGVTATVLLLAGTPLPLFAATSAAVVVIGGLVAVFEPYRRERLLSFIDPFSSGQPGYQVAQSFVGLGSGGFTGLGLGASRAKWGFLPNAHTDFIFAIIGEELGLVGALFVVTLFVALGALGLTAVRRAPDAFGALVAGGITAWLVGQAALNMATVVGVLPVTGVPLPFVSLGGTSTVIAMAAAGVLVNIARQGHAAAPSS